MARFRNDTGSVLHSQDFGVIPPGESEIDGYDPEVHGVIPGCTRLAEPQPDPAGDGKAAKRGKAASEQDKEPAQ